MLHGMFGRGDGLYWANYRKRFEAEGYRCVTPTLRYHDVDPTAAPDPRLGTTSLLDYVDDLEREIRALGDLPVIIGHSMGGLLGQMLASRGLARALVLLTPASPAGIMITAPSVMKTFASVQFRWGFWKNPMRITFKEAVYGVLNRVPTRTEQQALYDEFVFESGRAFFEIGHWMFDRRRASRVTTATVTCPTLIVGAEDDRITPVSIVRRVASKYAGVATYREYPGHAHWVLGQPRWEEIAGDVLDWIRRHEAA